MIIVHKINEIRAIVKEQRKSGKTIGLVPTMGALHDGHLSLLRHAKEETDFTILTIFVNPIQFSPNEDFNKYPRNINTDLKLASDSGADVIFTPDVSEMLGGNLLAFVDIEKLQDNLCGAKRPGHFRGVCTIVSKFFNIVDPDKAFFGKKDIQQLLILKKMVKDLNFDVEIISCPIIREKDGLAMSSRNVYLSDEERKDALILNQAIKTGIKLIENGETSSKKIIDKITAIILKKESVKIDYVKIVDENMKDADIISEDNIFALAAYFGKTRLIDNHIVGEKIYF